MKYKFIIIIIIIIIIRKLNDEITKWLSVACIFSPSGVAKQ